MVFYRKYRPQNISELDLDSVRERLESILKQKEIPHAFLFTGPKGLGKTSAARILAKAINCEKRLKNENGKMKNKKNSQLSTTNSQFIEPCNNCEACTSITNGSNIDVLEIDAASNRGIDEVRELRERIKYSPATLAKKVYIIDEVHMLTQDAFNALLKTLEEPPPHAIFVLCTTELEKVPATIKSRTFHITFSKPTKKEAVASLERIVKGEALDVEKGVLNDILIFSEGSFRDASKVLQELSIEADGKKITREILGSTYKAGSVGKEALEILVALSKNEAQTALSRIQKLADGGADFKIVTEKIADTLHGIIMKRFGLESDTDDIPEFSTHELNDILDKINESYRDIRFSVVPQLPLEVLIVEWCTSVSQNSKLSTKNEDEEKVENKKTEEISSEDKINEPKDSGHGMFAENAVPDNFFRSLLDTVKKDNHSIAGILRGCKLVDLGDDKVIFNVKYKFHHDKLNESKTAEILDKRASELLNRNIHVVVEMVAN